MIRKIVLSVTNALAYHCKIIENNYVSFIGLAPCLELLLQKKKTVANVINRAHILANCDNCCHINKKGGQRRRLLMTSLVLGRG